MAETPPRRVQRRTVCEYFILVDYRSKRSGRMLEVEEKDDE